MTEYLLKDVLMDKLEALRSRIPTKLLPMFDDNFKVVELKSSVSFNYFAMVMREILTRTINSLVDNSLIRKATWFPSYGTHGDDPKKISTKQKLAYIALKGHSMDVLFKRFSLEHTIYDLCDMLQQMNDYVHLEMKVDSDQIEKELEKVILICGSFFEFLDKIQNEIESLIEITQEGIFDEVVNSTIQEIDEIATHYYDPDVDIHDVIITDLLDDRINGMRVRVECHGSISAELQYGSDADQGRGDGATFPVSFPLGCTVELSYEMDGDDLTVMDVEVTSIEVDNSSWFDE
jgi:hypothetical protein